MTKLHKVDGNTLVMTDSNGGQYLISNVCVVHAKNINVDGLEELPFDSEVFNMVESAALHVPIIMNDKELSILKSWLVDKIQSAN